MKKVLREQLNQIEGKEVILAIGQTGCGKSTMLTALVYGPQALQQEKLEKESVVKDSNGNNKTITSKQFVISQKQDLNIDTFHIGHH